MSLLTRKRALLAKLESVYGTDPTPTGALNSMLVANLEVQPLAAETVQRQIIKPYLGNAETLIAAASATASFEIEAVGSGTVGLAPAYDALLKACGYARATTTRSITASITDEVVTVTLNSHGYQSGDVITHAGFTDVACNIAAVITRIDANSYSYPAPGAVNDLTADGTPVVNSAIVYSPVSTAFESATLYFYNDQVLHKLTGARGSFEINVEAKAIPVFRFSFTGLYNPATDDEVAGAVFTAFKIPEVSNTENTPAFSLFSYSGVLQSMNVNLSNEVIYRTLIGSEDVRIVDRRPEGNFVMEAPLIATKDFFEAAKDAETGAMTLTQGSKNGFKVKLDAPKVNIQNPSYQDQDGVQMLSIPFTLSPNSGNDEFTITFL